MRRATPVFALVAMVAALAAAPITTAGAGLGSEDDDDEQVAYTFGYHPDDGIAPVGPLCKFYELDLETGAATQVNQPSNTVVNCGDGLTFDDDGTLFAYRNVPTAAVTFDTELVTIDLDDGSQHLVGGLPPVGVGSGGMTFDAEGDLWLYGFAPGDPTCVAAAGVGGFPVCLWEIDPDDASARFVGTPGGDEARGVYGLTADCEEVLAITSAAATGAPTLPVRLDEVDTGNASLEKIVDLPGVASPDGLDYDADGDLWAVGTSYPALDPFLYRIDPTDGTSQPRPVTFALFDSGVLFGLAASPIECAEPAPEPAPPAPVVVEPVFTG